VRDSDAGSARVISQSPKLNRCFAIYNNLTLMLILPKLKLAFLGALWFALVAGLCFALLIATLTFPATHTLSQGGKEVLVGLWLFGPSAAVAGFLLANRVIKADVMASFFSVYSL
jgi:hypothetical protein